MLQTVRQLEERGIKVIVLQLGNTDLTSAAGKLLLSMLAAVAEMGPDLLVERTQAGLQRAKAEGKTLGRLSPAATPLPRAPPALFTTSWIIRYASSGRNIQTPRWVQSAR